MATIDAEEFAARIEEVLHQMDRTDLIPEYGLGSWVGQAWPPAKDNRDPEEWALDWIDQCNQPAV